MQGAFEFLQNVEGKDLLMRELKKYREDRSESCITLC
jgi:hypothetical protein